MYVFVHHSFVYYPFLAHSCMLFLLSFVVYAIFCVTDSVEARLSVGFSLSWLRFSPGTLCGSFYIVCLPTAWPLAVPLVICILCLTFVTYHNYALTVCINCLHELFDSDKLINIDIMNFPRFQQFSLTQSMNSKLQNVWS